MKNEIIEGVIKVKTGLHIGGIKETIKIGGQDAPVIKMRMGKREVPYIPGSSLKGKLRYLLETKYSNNEIVKKIFGNTSQDTQAIKGAVIFRDAHLHVKNEEQLSNEQLLEIKAENRIERTTGKAVAPRFIERVVPGVEFEVEMVIQYNDDDELQQIKRILKEGFELLQNDYLGGSGTRGYGKIDASDIIQKL